MVNLLVIVVLHPDRQPNSQSNDDDDNQRKQSAVTTPSALPILREPPARAPRLLVTVAAALAQPRAVPRQAIGVALAIPGREVQGRHVRGRRWHGGAAGEQAAAVRLLRRLGGAAGCCCVGGGLFASGGGGGVVLCDDGHVADIDERRGRAAEEGAAGHGDGDDDGEFLNGVVAGRTDDESCVVLDVDSEGRQPPSTCCVGCNESPADWVSQRQWEEVRTGRW